MSTGEDTHGLWRDPREGQLPALPVLKRARWPMAVMHLGAYFNPQAIPFPESVDSVHCDCTSSCRASTCQNALLGYYCTAVTCAQKARCGNTLKDWPYLTLMRERGDRDAIKLIATSDIDEGVVLGRYLGALSLVEWSRHSRPPNQRYCLHFLQNDFWGDAVVRVNSLQHGCLMRFVNHSNNPSASFRQVSRGTDHAIVVVTSRAIIKGEEITAYYNDEAWFT